VVLPGLRSVHGASVRSVQAVSTGLPLMYITNTTTGPLMGGAQRAYAVSYALVCPTTLHHQASGWSGMCVTRQSSKVSFRLPGLLLRTAVATPVPSFAAPSPGVVQWDNRLSRLVQVQASRDAVLPQCVF
jgi:hypothetical protein